MKVVIPGGSGQVGQILARSFVARGDEVVVLSRGAVACGRAVAWDGRTLGGWASEIDGADVVINLAGRTVNCRYTDSNLRQMMDSRVESTRAVGEAIGRCSTPPPVWLQMSTATIYAHRFDAANDEATGVIGGDEPDVPGYWEYSVRIASEWERAVFESDVPCRRVALRTAMVMSPDRGGVLDVLLGLTRLGLGGAAAGGAQYVSWIADVDFVRAVDFLIASDLAGAVNLSSPGPVPHASFMRGLRDAWGIRVGLPATRWMLELGAVGMRTDTELLLKSRRVVPGRLLGAGFAFEFPEWDACAKDQVTRWRALRS